MERILAILAEEPRYAEELAAYLRARQEFIFCPIAFSDPEAYCRYDSQNHVDMLLCEENFAAARGHALKAENICVLSELTYARDPLLQVYPEIFKYQASEKIMNDIISVYGRRQKDREPDTGQTAIHENGRMICVCSPVGGSYKSTFALALAQYYSRGGRTLFLSFDPFFTLPQENKTSTDKNLTDVLYYLECFGREPVGMVEKISRRLGNLDYISGVSHWFDVESIRPEHMTNFLQALERSTFYETIVIDLGITGSAMMELLIACSCIYVPLGRGNSRSRIEEWKRQLGFIGKEELISRIKEVNIPYDELLEGDYTFEQLLKGRTGRFIEEMEGCRYLR